MSCITLILNSNLATLDRAQARAVSHVQQDHVRHECRTFGNRPEIRLNWIMEKDARGRNQLRMQWSPEEAAR